MEQMKATIAKEMESISRTANALTATIKVTSLQQLPQNRSQNRIVSGFLCQI
jgi:hypothetical protein